MSASMVQRENAPCEHSTEALGYMSSVGLGDFAEESSDPEWHYNLFVTNYLTHCETHNEGDKHDVLDYPDEPSEEV